MPFEVGEKCVVPQLGVGIVRAVEEMNFEGTIYRVYQIKILENGLNYTCPVDQADANGLRALIPKDAIERVYDVLKDRGKPADKQTWNRRYREYMAKIQTGDPMEVAAVLRDLSMLKQEKTLSFGERRMYDKAHGLIVQEVSAAKDVDEDVIEKEIAKIFKK
jgi:CarD family transcriptional regulator